MSDRCDYCKAALFGPVYVARIVYGGRGVLFCDRLCGKAYLEDGEPEPKDAQRSPYGEPVVPWRPSVKEWLYD